MQCLAAKERKWCKSPDRRQKICSRKEKTGRRIMEKTEKTDRVEMTGKTEKSDRAELTGNYETERKKGLKRGVLYGVIGTLLVNTLLFAGIAKLTGGNMFVIGKAGGARTGSTILDSETVSKIEELKAYADLYYYDEIDEAAMKDGLYTGLISGLGDKYSVYYDAEKNTQMQIDTTGQYYGIGAGLWQDPDTMAISVSKVYEGTPSETAGLLTGDIILSVDGVDAGNMEVADLVKLIRGEEGSTVHLDVFRAATGENLSFDVERANVTLPSITCEMMENGIGYIRIVSFEKETAVQFEEAVAEFETQGLKGLIIDVRYNGGGLVSSVVQILDDILPEGLVVYTEDKNGNRQEYTSEGDTYMDYPLAVLINESSASASEILAGAIKDYKYGTLIGTTTFGKGIMQTVFQLEDGDAIKLTTAKYFTPNGNYIHGVGIEPDVTLEYEYLDPEGEKYEAKYDNQILKAIEILSEEIGTP